MFAASPISFEEITSQLEDVDIVVTSTASPDFVITYEQVKGCLRKRRNRPLFFIDIAVPRDVQPDVNDLDNVYVYDIDDLKGIIQVNIEQRELEAVKAERIVLEEVLQFQKWLKTLAVVPTIVSLREKAETIVQAELKKSRPALGGLTPSQIERIEILTRSVAEKVLSDPISFLKRKAERPTLNSYLDMAKQLFSLDKE